MTTKARLKLFEESFSEDSKTVYERLKNLAFAGNLKGSGLRSLCWRLFLGSIPSEDVSRDKWISSVDEERSEYARLREKFLVNPYKEEKDDKDLVVNNPLAETKESIWCKYFELQELQKEIMTDVERLAMEEEILKEEATHEAMLRILTIWASLHPQVAYRQGMHEVLAPLFFILHADSLDVSTASDEEDSSNPVLTLWDRAFVEHDAFALFSMLMLHLTDSFAPPQRPAKGAGPPKPSGVVQRCERMQNELLRDKDYQLYIHLQGCQVQPQIYAMKWIRLLLGREFHLDDVLLLWDALFADYHASHHTSPRAPDPDAAGLALLDWIMVAMVRFVRLELLNADNMGCLRRLMKFPPVEDVRVFVVQALQLRSSKGPAQNPAPASGPATPPPASTASRAIPINGTGAPNFIGNAGGAMDRARMQPSQPSAPQPPPPSSNPHPFSPPEHQDHMPPSPLADAREDSGDVQPGALEGLCGGPMLSALSVLESLLPPPSDPRHAPAAAAIAQIHTFHAHVSGMLQSQPGPTRPVTLETQQPQQQNMVGIGAWAGQRRAGGTKSPSPAASPAGGARGRPGGEEPGSKLGFEPLEAAEAVREGSGGWEKVEKEKSAAQQEQEARAARAAEERQREREQAAAAAAAKKKATEEAAQKRKAALGMLLEPPSPNSVSAVDDGKEEEEFGTGVFGKPKLNKGGSSASSSKDLFGDDGLTKAGTEDVSSWLNPKR